MRILILIIVAFGISGCASIETGDLSDVTMAGDKYTNRKYIKAWGFNVGGKIGAREIDTRFVPDLNAVKQ